MIHSVRVGGQEADGSLFDTFAALARDEIVSFPALRPHQRMPVHAFFVQVAALALHRAGRTELPEDESSWRELLLALTPEWPGGEAWELTVADWSKPALLQPPVTTAAAIAEHKPRALTPDALDMLVTSKNHDIKAERLADREDVWLFALITVQTTAGVLGAGKYGISRMNGGYGSRVFMSIRPPGHLGAAFRRDVRELLNSRAEIIHRHPDLADDGLGLVWTRPWGDGPLPYAGLDPFYVEICRRVRLIQGQGGIVGHTAGSKTSRIEAKALNGRTGDPWAPLDAGGDKSWGIGDGAFGYRKVAVLLDRAQVTPPPLAALTSRDALDGIGLRLTAVRGGQGKTEGFHDRIIPIARRVPQSRGPGKVLDALAEAAQDRAVKAGEVGRILRHAIFALHRRGSEAIDLSDKSIAPKVAPWMDAFDRSVDAVFFGEGFQDQAAKIEAPHAVIWTDELASMARETFTVAAASSSLGVSKRMRAQAEGRTLLERRLRSYLSQFKEAADV
jgi:CRISPR system Cascade subunit CasA